MIKYIIYFILSILLLSQPVVTYQSDVNYYLDSKSECIQECGSQDSPFRTFNNAITTLSKIKDHTSGAVLIVQEGQYFGNGNKDIHINFDISIVSIKGSKYTIIDCENAGNGFIITGTSTFEMNGFTIQNCNAGEGGAMFTTNPMTNLEDMIFLSNSAREGSAIYSSSQVFNIIESIFYQNTGGYTIYFNGVRSEITETVFNLNSKDMYCSGGSTIFAIDSRLGSICNDCSILNRLSPDSDNICGLKSSTSTCNYDGICQDIVETFDNCPNDCQQPTAAVCVKDSICDSDNGETFETCPSDCDSDEHPGWKLDIYENALLHKPTQATALFTTSAKKSSTEFIPFAEVFNFLGKQYFPVSARMTSQVQVDKDGFYFFELNTKNVNAIIFVNGRILFDTFMADNTPSHSSHRKILMSQDKTTDIEIVFVSLSNDPRDFSFKWRHESSTVYQSIPSYYVTLKDTFKCGDGICNEKHPESCIADCYAHIERLCPAQSPPAPLDYTYGKTKKDTFGVLLNNQYIFSLPGIHHLSHGIDIRTGIPNPTPLFGMTYCDNTSFSIVQDPLRELVFSVPEGIFAQLYSKCTSDTVSTTYSSSNQMKKDKSEDKSIDVSANVGGGTAFIHVAVDASLSLSQSTKSAKETEDKTEGSITNTEVYCETARAHIVEHKFHPKFIEDIANTLVMDPVGNINQAETDKKMKIVIEKYGSLYHKTATLGGKLEIHTVTNHTYSRDKSTKDLAKSIDMSASAQLSSKVFSASASASGTLDSKTSKTDQSTFDNESSSSTVVVHGGEPGSYGKSTTNAFALWASTIDLSPIPVDYQVGYISDIIPSSWYLVDRVNVKKMWARVEMDLFKAYFNTTRVKYLTPELLDTLSRSDTVYFFKSSTSDIFKGDVSLEITDFKEKVYSYSNFELVSNNLLVLRADVEGEHFEDTRGIKSIKLIPSSTPTPTPSSTPSTDINLQLYNIFTSRYYFFNSLQDSLVKPTSNQITLEFSNLRLICANPCSAEISIFTDERETTPFLMDLEIDTNQGPIFYTTFKNSDIGRILGYDVYISSVGIVEDSTYYLEYSNLVIRQSCPDQAFSRCIPNKVVFDKEYGYTKAYERYILPNEPNLKHILTPLPKWFAIEPLGQ